MKASSESAEPQLIAPHGGQLINLIAEGKRRDELISETQELPKWTLTPRQLCDIEQIITGAFSPLRGFMNRNDYENVRDDMRLSDGTLWPMPIVLDMPAVEAETLKSGNRLALMHPEGALIAVITINDLWEPDRAEEAQKVFNTTDAGHPGVDSLMNRTHSIYIGGEIEAVTSSQHHTYSGLRHTPSQLRNLFNQLGWSRIVAFQTRNPMHRAHVELTRRAAEKVNANLLIHPVVGLTRPGDVEYHTRVRCYKAVIDGYPQNSATLSLLQLAMRMGGPREAVWHAIVRKNYGCTHFIVGRDHAGPGNDTNGNPYYGPYDAQELVEKYHDELGIRVVTFQEVVYEGNSDRYMTRDELPENAQVMNLSGTELRNRLQSGADIPAWFSYPDVIKELRKSYPPLEKRGFNILITGLPGSGKSTLAKVLEEKLLEDGSRPVTTLDGAIDVAASTLIAREAAKNGGAIITESTRASADDARAEVETYGIFIQTHLSTAPEVCDARTRTDAASKSKPDTPSDKTEIVIDTSTASPADAAQQVMDYLSNKGLISA